MLRLNTTHFKQLRNSGLFRPQEPWTYTIQKSFVRQAQLKMPQTYIDDMLFLSTNTYTNLSKQYQGSQKSSLVSHPSPTPFLSPPKNKETSLGLSGFINDVTFINSSNCHIVCGVQQYSHREDLKCSKMISQPLRKTCTSHAQGWLW